MLLLREEMLKNLGCRILSLAKNRLRIWGLAILRLTILRLTILRLAILRLTMLRLALGVLRLDELLESLEGVYTWKRCLSRGGSACDPITSVLTKDWQGGLEGVHDEVSLRLNIWVLTDLSHIGTIVRRLRWSLVQMLLVL